MPAESGVTFALIIPIIILVIVFFTVAITVGIGVYVYRDAKKREMNAALWTLVVLLAPGLIGLIIYLIVRSDREIKNTSCSYCGNKIDDSFNVCPYCSHVLKPHCPHCSHPIGAGWYSCPSCGEPIPDELRVSTTEKDQSRDRGLTVILSAVIIVPIVLIVLAIVAFFMMTGRTVLNDKVYTDESFTVESVSPDEITLNITVSIHDDIDNVYSALITYYSGGNSVESCGVSNADGTSLSSIYFSDSFSVYDTIDEFEIEFCDENGNVLETTGKIKFTDSTFIDASLDLNHGTPEFSY